MKESVLTRKTYKDLKAGSGFYDFVKIGKNVWRATLDGRYCLLKTSHGSDTASFQLLTREYEITRNLRHPNIVETNDMLEDTEKGPVIVMEYVKGRTLREFLKEKPSVSKRRKVLMQLLDAVEYLHIKGILHNDIKSDNIMITDIGDDVKLIDFGLSECTDDFMMRRLGGTKGASAPEVLTGDLMVSSTGASDIYSIGGIMTLLFKHRYASVIRKCLSDNPSERYKDVASLRNAIKRYDRRPLVFCSLLLFCLLLTAAILPDVLRKCDERREALETEAQITAIQRDMDIYYRNALDTIMNPSMVPYREFAYPVMNGFVNNTSKYRKRLDGKWHFVCDSIYPRMLNGIIQSMLELPSYSDLAQKNLITPEEEYWYHELYINDKPYVPYKKGR